jgi:outer membrane lipoprotein-sorting protein
MFFLLIGGAYAPAVKAQNPDTLMPEESAAKAKHILQQLIDALGGQTYLNVHESECEGRLAQFGHNGDLTGYEDFRDYWHYPDKNRTDYTKKGNIIDLFNGNEGWSMDRGGVTEMPAPQVADFQEQVKTDIDNLLRLRLHEEGLAFRYGGPDIVDLKQVDWVEIGDTDERTFRLAVDQESHLLVRSVVITRDETTRERTTETTYYSNFQPRDGVETPLQQTRTRDGRRIYQVFFETCKYNPGFPADLFTKAALEKRFGEVGGGKKGKDKKKKDRD